MNKKREVTFKSCDILTLLPNVCHNCLCSSEGATTGKTSTFTGMLINKQNLKETYRQKDPIRKSRQIKSDVGEKCLILCNENKCINELKNNHFY